VDGQDIGQDREARLDLSGASALDSHFAQEVCVKGQGIKGSHDSGQRVGQRKLLRRYAGLDLHAGFSGLSDELVAEALLLGRHDHPPVQGRDPLSLDIIRLQFPVEKDVGQDDDLGDRVIAFYVRCRVGLRVT